MKQFKVTIGVRCYNSEKYIERCARSLFEQSYQNCDYLFVDDCSKDNTIGIINKVVKDYPDRVNQLRIIKRETNGNRAACMNTVLENIQGDFFTLVDSDDYLVKDAIELFLQAQKFNNADLVLCEMKKILRDRESIDHLQDCQSGRELCISQLGCMTRWSVWGSFIKSSLISPDIRCISDANMGEDYAVEVRITYNADKVYILHDPLYIYDRTNENSSMFKFNEEFRRQFDVNMDMLYRFFQDKGVDFVDAWYHTRIISLIEDVKEICIAGGHDEFYKDRVKRIKTIEAKHKAFYPVTYKTIESLLWCRPLLYVLLKLNKIIREFREL